MRPGVGGDERGLVSAGRGGASGRVSHRAGLQCGGPDRLIPNSCWFHRRDEMRHAPRKYASAHTRKGESAIELDHGGCKVLCAGQQSRRSGGHGSLAEPRDVEAIRPMSGYDTVRTAALVIVPGAGTTIDDHVCPSAAGPLRRYAICQAVRADAVAARPLMSRVVELVAAMGGSWRG